MRRAYPFGSKIFEVTYMTIRPITPPDINQIINLWNTTLIEDQINIENFYTRIIYDINFDPNLFLLAEENNNIIGFIYGTKEIVGLQDIAWIVAMGVSQKRKGIGTKLVKALEKALNTKTIELGAYTTNYFFPGVDEENYKDAVLFFESLGYEVKNQCSSMDMSLRGYIYPEKYINRKLELEKDGWNFTPYTKETYLPTISFMRAHFPYWLPNIRNNILAGTGEESIQLAIAPSGEVAGFAMRAMDGTPGRFGPFSVAPDKQGTGLGGILFHELVSDMVRRRIFYTWFLWTGGQNLDIYGTWGMKIYRTYKMMRKVV